MGRTIIAKYLFTIQLILFLIVSTNKDLLSCTGGTLAGSITLTPSWATMGGIDAGDRFTFTIGTNEAVIFSFCQSGGSYTSDPMISILNQAGTVEYISNDDHCGLGSEVIWVCPASGTYSISFHRYNCNSDGTALGTIAYRLLPTPTEQDCLGARALCSTISNHPISYSGHGHYYDIIDFNDLFGMAVNVNNCPNCLVTGELNNVWYTFTAQTAGNIAFTISPINSADDYDWALYSLNGGVTCFDLLNHSANPPISCNFCGTSGTTGAGSGSVSCNGPNSCSNFNSAFTVTPGATYVLTVSNFSATQSGYSIDFGASTSTIVDNSTPMLGNIVYPPYCGSSSLTIQMSEAVHCTSVQPADFELTGPAGTYSITDVISMVCESASSNTYAGTWYDAVWTLQLGDFLSNSGDYTLRLIPGSIADKCNNVNNENLLNFTIIGITADVTTTGISGCFGDNNGSITVSNIRGGTEPYTCQWTGPNGFTSSNTTLTGLAPGTYNLTITDAEGICEFVWQTTLVEAPAINPTLTNNGPLCQNSDLQLSVTADVPISTYAWSGPNGFTSSIANPTISNATEAAAGIYSVTLTDAYGCSEENTTNAVITAVQPISINLNHNSNYCENETITFTTTNITGATYSWSGPSGFTSSECSPSITHCRPSDAGIYSVTVTDANNCTTSASTTSITISPGITGDLTSQNPLCHNSATGSISLNISNGTAPYSPVWSNGATTNNIVNLTANYYCVTITDAALCRLILCQTLVEPAQLVTTATTVATECGKSEGEINLSTTGGTPNYTYQCSESHSGSHITGLHPGTYTITTIDANNCTETIQATINFYGSNTVNITQTQSILCHGNKEAALSANMLAGCTPYTYSWSVAGQNASTISNIGSGTYSITIQDHYGCTGTASYDITEPLPISIVHETQDVTCRGEKNGALTLIASGGVAPYTYKWNTNSTSSHISSLGAGTYTVTIKDINNCSISESFEITQPEQGTSIEMITKNVTCHGMHNASAQAVATGGSAPYIIYWYLNNKLITTGTQANSLGAGTYIVELYDTKNCHSQTSFTISNPDELIIQQEMSPVTCRGYNDGLVGINIVGGKLPYQINWNIGDTATHLVNLKAGTYTVTIIDDYKCKKTLSINIPENPNICIDIPDAFTPNGDGINDTWIIGYRDMYPYIVIYVFNRWGQKFYEGRKGDAPWDGKYKGKLVPTGTYLYVIDFQNGFAPYTGTLTVVY